MRRWLGSGLRQMVGPILLVTSLVWGLLPPKAVADEAVPTATPTLAVSATTSATPTVSESASASATLTPSASVTVVSTASAVASAILTSSATAIPVATSTAARPTFTLTRTATATVTVAMPTAIAPTATVPFATKGSIGPKAAITSTTGNPFTELAVGLMHSCGLTATGSAWCWGWNQFGQVGDGTSGSSASARPTPVGVSGRLFFSSISSGGFHTCGLSSGKAYCWGSNSDGQLGDGTTDHTGAPKATPVAVSGTLNFTKIAAGYAHTCGLASSGHAYCWGDNSSGQIGDGSTTDRSEPVPVIGEKTFVSISVGSAHVCAITQAGEAYCWGSNSTGKIGDGGATESGQIRTQPVVVAGGLALTSISAGASHTCGLTPNGAAYCWGFNGGGQVGDGSTADRSTPNAVAGGFTFAQVTAAKNHSCGITTSGSMVCWGYSRYGQVGDGTTGISRLTPVLISGAMAFLQLASGADASHTCAITISGSSYCWGLNAYGQIGDGAIDSNDVDHSADRLTPVAVDVSAVPVPGPAPTATPVVPTPALISLAAGGSFTCGLSADGTAFCWGSNSHGQLGDGNAGIWNASPSPVEVKGGLKFVNLFAGGSAACGLTANGQAYCWGANWGGQLGDGTTTNRSIPVAVTGTQKFTRLALGPSFSCGLSADGLAYCWGSNLLPGYPSTPHAVPGGLVLKDIAAGQNHVCALTPTGAAWCWGRNQNGELGSGETGSGSDVPVAVNGGRTFARLTAGYDHTCALASTGESFCWGDNASGQIGDGTSGGWRDDHSVVRAAPVVVAGGHEFVELGGGFQHTCGLTATGAAYCWGYNLSGQVGDGSTANRESPTIVVGGRVFTTLSVGEAHACALTPRGEAWCWGRDTDGQLGDGILGVQTSPVAVAGARLYADIATGTSYETGHTCAITLTGATFCWGSGNDGRVGDSTSGINRATPAAVAGGATFAQITTGSGNTCGLTASGAAWCWGSNWYGSVGDGTSGNGSRGADRSVPVLVAGGITLVSLVSGGIHTCGLTASGAAYCWGYNADGAVGDGTAIDRPSPVAVTGGKTFTAITVGGSHTCGLTSSGSAYCWGRNANGQFGDGTTLSSPTTAPIPSALGLTLTSVAAGGSHTCGLTSSGRAYCWGANWSGQLGDGSTSTQTQPVAVMGGLSFTAISAGSYHACGLTSDGQAYCWGANSEGQLGDGTREVRLVPVAVGGGLTFSRLATGAKNTCGILRGIGSAFCWGDSSVGALGDGRLGYQSAPVRVGSAPTPNPTIRAIRLANVRDTSFTVSWVTDVASTGTVSWRLGTSSASPTFAVDVRGADTSSTVHQVTVTGLAASTRYLFDVTSGTTTETNGGAHFAVTTGPVLSIPATDSVYGTVVRKDGTTPSAVTVQLTASGSAGTSAPLATLVRTNDAKTWILGLGNLRTADASAAFTYTDTTILTVQADGGADGTAVGTVTVADARTGKLALTLSDEIATPLQTGWNLVALQVTPASPVTAMALCASLVATVAGSAYEIDRWENSGWDSHRCGLAPNNFTLEPGRGYFIRVTKPVTWSVGGTRIITPQSLSLGTGWNLFGVGAIAPGTVIAPSGCTAMDGTAGTGTVVELDRWEAGAWEGHRCGLPVNAFPLQAGRGYFVRLTRPATWAPAGGAP